MFKADILFKYDGRKIVNVINVQIIPRTDTSYPYGLSNPHSFDEYHVIYMEYNGIKSDVVRVLSDITVLF